MNFLKLHPVDGSSFLLFDTFTETFEQHGHRFVDSLADAQVALFDIESCGGKRYDEARMEGVLSLGIPVVSFEQFEYHPEWFGERDQWFGFHDWRKLEQLSQLQPWASWLLKFVRSGALKLYFMRELPRSPEFPAFVHPFGQVWYPGHEFLPASKSGLWNRKNDFCFIGGVNAVRANLCCDLLRHGFKVDSYFPPGDRIPHEGWLNRHHDARIFCNDDGSDRFCQLMAIAPMIRLRGSHRHAAPWIDGVNCIEVAQDEGTLLGGEADKLRQILGDPDRLHEIYMNGIEHMNRHYSARGRTLYLLDCMKQSGLL